MQRPRPFDPNTEQEPVFVFRYFYGETPPALITPDGAALSAMLVMILAGPVAPGWLRDDRLKRWSWASVLFMYQKRK